MGGEEVVLVLVLPEWLPAFAVSLALTTASFAFQRWLFQ